MGHDRGKEIHIKNANTNNSDFTLTDQDILMELTGCSHFCRGFFVAGGIVKQQVFYCGFLKAAALNCKSHGCHKQCHRDMIDQAPSFSAYGTHFSCERFLTLLYAICFLICKMQTIRLYVKCLAQSLAHRNFLVCVLQI